jgi:hypothetical protein
MTTVTELVTKFTFKGNATPLANFNTELAKAIPMMAKTAAGIAAVTAAMGAFVITTLKGFDSQRAFNLETGISVEKVQKLGYAATIAGGSADAMQSSLVNLTQKIGQAALYGSAEFARIGIDARDAAGNVKKADQVIFELADRFRQLNMSDAEKQTLLASLGIDKSMLGLLKMSRVEIDKLTQTAAKLGVVTDKDAEKIYKFNNAIYTLKFGMDSLKTKIAIGLSPAIQRMAERFTEFLIKYQPQIVSGIETISKVIGSLFEAIGRIIGFIKDFIQATVGWEAALAVIIVALGALASPAVLVAGAISAILLVVDDLIVAFKGGKSVIRDFFAEFLGIDITPILKNIVEGFKNAFALIKAMFKDLIKLFTNPLGLFKGDSDIVKWGKGQDWSMGAFAKDMQEMKKAASIENTNPISKNQTNNITKAEINQDIKINLTTQSGETAGRDIVNNLQNQLQNAYVQLGIGNY